VPWEACSLDKYHRLGERTVNQMVPKCPAVLSIIGWHAGESPADIVRRKRADIQKTSSTIWLYQSQLASIQDVQHFGVAYPNPAVYFLEGSAYPAKTTQAAREMSSNGSSSWVPLPRGIGKVTGRLPSGGLFIGALTSPLLNHDIDLWEFFEHSTSKPLRFRQGASTACVLISQAGAVQGMKSRVRKVVAIGQLTPPYAVYLR
jgi:hypothetical protein